MKEKSFRPQPPGLTTNEIASPNSTTVSVHRKENSMKTTKALLLLAVLFTLSTTTARADEVTDWNRNMFEAARLNVPPTGPLPLTRNAALVQAAVFDEDLSFTSLLITPNHPEYPSGHSCLSGAAGEILAKTFGEHAKLTVSSDAPEMAGVVRSYDGFPEILQEIKDARVFAGIHFRSACDAGQQLGVGVADYVRDNALKHVRADEADDDN